jgi:hypothetical protein
MAGGTIRPQLPLMGIILGMAGVASLRGRFEVSQIAGTIMAGCTIKLSMLASKWEGNLCMVKRMAISVDTIMARQTIITVCLLVGLHKICLELLVAVNTYSLIKG